MRIIIFSGFFTITVLLCMVMYVSLTERVNVNIIKFFKNETCGAYTVYINSKGEYIESILQLDCITMETMQKNEEQFYIACKNGVYLNECAIGHVYALFLLLTLYIIFGLSLIARRVYMSDEYIRTVATMFNDVPSPPVYCIPCREVIVDNNVSLAIGTPESPNKNNIIVCQNP